MQKIKKIICLWITLYGAINTINKNSNMNRRKWFVLKNRIIYWQLYVQYKKKRIVTVKQEGET